MDTLQTIQEIIDLYNTRDTELIGTYIDTLKNYYKNNILDKDYFQKEPDFSALSKQDTCFLTGLFEYYSNKFHFKHPYWMNKKKYMLDDPYFPSGASYPKLRMLLMCESPMEMKRRNIFISKNGLERV